MRLEREPYKTESDVISRKSNNTSSVSTTAAAYLSVVGSGAFATSNVILRRFANTRRENNVCVFAHAKRNSSDSKREARIKRVHAKNNASTRVNNNTISGKPAPSDDITTDNVTKEEVSGASGDATPHRAMTQPTVVKMDNPEQDPLDAPTEPLILLPNLTREEINSLRLDPKSTPEQIMSYFEEAKSRDDFVSLIVANRDFLTESVLYRFTSAILQVENRAEDIETREEESRNMRQLRKELIAICWSIDFPLKVEIQRAEVRLLEVLKGGNIKRDVKRLCGRSTLEVNSFWIVIFAAVAAWEERGRENPELVNIDVQKSLTDAADACKSLEVVDGYLSPSLKAVQEILTSTDPDTQKRVVSEFSEEDIAELGSFTEKIRLLPTPAYGALVRRCRSIKDYVAAEKYNVPPPSLEPLRFTLAPIDRQSKLVQISKANDLRNKR